MTNQKKLTAKDSIRYITKAGLIAALYVVLTWLSALLGLDKNAIQCRFSEALCVLPAFLGSCAIPGLTLGCFLANLMTGSVALDIIFGSLATLLGALGAYFLRKVAYTRASWLIPLPTILANTLTVPFVIRFAYGTEDAMWFLFLTVGAGELIAAGVLGFLLTKVLARYRRQLSH